VILPSTLESRVGGIARLRRMSPGDTYGSWLHPGALDPSYGDAILARVIAGKESTRWLINPFLDAAVRPSDTGRATHTSAMDLSRTFEVLRASWSKGHRSAVGQARRSGVTISVASTIDEWRDYYATYEASLQRWGTSATSRYPWAFFEQLQRYRDGVKLWLAKIEGRVVAGALCLYSPTIVAYWHGAAYEAAFAKRPVNLLLHDAIQDASARGARWFDLGPSGGHEGVERFKRGFAPERLVVHMVDRATPAMAAARWVRRHIRRVGR
jgi:lipid II:glycine glycyltransferase (peptidoglycan interpeptide bridge formation enzyme)